MSILRALAAGVILAGACQCSERPDRSQATSASPAPPASSTATASSPATSTASPSAPGQRLDGVGKPQRIAAGDLDGDGQPELVVVDGATLRVTDAGGRERARMPTPGGIQVLRVATVGGRGAILAGWGRTRDHREARARISVVRFENERLAEEIVAEPATERDEVVEILSSDDGLVVAHFTSKYEVQLARATKAEGWQLSPIARIRMGTSYALGDVDGDGEPDLVVGRVYGDEVGSDGDAFVLRPDGTRVPIPVVGGVRSLAVADLDGDGRQEILIGDGWNRDYGKVARARLTRVRWQNGAFSAELIEESPGQYTLWNLVVADLDGDGRADIATRGDTEIRKLTLRDRWQATTVAKGCHDLALLDLHPVPALIAACPGGVELFY
jgi:hypothetical protein